MACCAPLAPALLVHLNLMLVVYAGAGLATAARLKWDPSTYVPLRQVFPAEYRVAAVALCVLAWLLLALAHLGAAALRCTGRARRPALLTYAVLMTALVCAEVAWVAWSGARVAAWLHSEQAAQMMELLELREHLQPILGLLARWHPLPDKIRELIEEATEDAPRNLYASAVTAALVAVLQPAAALLALLAAVRRSPVPSSPPADSLRYNTLAYLAAHIPPAPRNLYASAVTAALVAVLQPAAALLALLAAVRRSPVPSSPPADSLRYNTLAYLAAHIPPAPRNLYASAVTAALVAVLQPAAALLALLAAARRSPAPSSPPADSLRYNTLAYLAAHIPPAPRNLYASAVTAALVAVLQPAAALLALLAVARRSPAPSSPPADSLRYNTLAYLAAHIPPAPRNLYASAVTAALVAVLQPAAALLALLAAVRRSPVPSSPPADSLRYNTLAYLAAHIPPAPRNLYASAVTAALVAVLQPAAALLALLAAVRRSPAPSSPPADSLRYNTLAYLAAHIPPAPRNLYASAVTAALVAVLQPAAALLALLAAVRRSPAPSSPPADSLSNLSTDNERAPLKTAFRNGKLVIV